MGLGGAGLATPPGRGSRGCRQVDLRTCANRRPGKPKLAGPAADQPPVTWAMFFNASLKAFAGSAPFVSTLPSDVSMALWICVSYGPIETIFNLLAESPKICPIGALLK